MLDERLQAGHAALEALAPRGKGLENCARRAAEQLAALRAFAQGGETGEVQWFESFAHGFALHLSPLDCATPLRALRTARTAAWVFTSATLSVGGSLAHFARAVGLGDDDYTGLTLESPFDYARNALCYLPEALPEPQDSGYTRAVVEAAVPVLAASQGHAFLLFTSHRALKEAAELLAGRTPWPLLVQGDAPRAQLLARFRSEPHAVLLGAASFWEGVDVRGPQLSCVIIDKLPFASPGDPLTAARIEALRAQGANPFRDYQLPNAVLALKQGVGRLIRDVHDRGVLVLCDPRVTGKPYGRVFLDSLPPIPRTRRLADVEGFFATPPA